MAGLLRRDGRRDGFAGGRRHRELPDDGRGRLLAAADARRRENAHAGTEQTRQSRQQVLRARHLARQAVADAHRDRRRYDVAFLDDIEVVIERRDLEHFRLRQLHLVGERREVGRAQVAEAILQLVQVFDQEVASARLVTEQLEHLGTRLRVDAPAARRLALALAR